MKLPRVFATILSGLLLFSANSIYASDSYELMRVIVESQNRIPPSEDALNEFNIDPMTYASVILAGKIDLRDPQHAGLFYNSLLPIIRMLDDSSHFYTIHDRTTPEYRAEFGDPVVYKQKLDKAAHLLGLFALPSPQNVKTCVFPVEGLDATASDASNNFGLSSLVGLLGNTTNATTVSFVFSSGEDFCNPEFPMANDAASSAPRKNSKCCKEGAANTDDDCPRKKNHYCTRYRDPTHNNARKCSDNSDPCPSNGSNGLGTEGFDDL